MHSCSPTSGSVQTAVVVLKGGHLNTTTEPLDVQVSEVVVLIVLNDGLLQFTDLTLHP